MHGSSTLLPAGSLKGATIAFDLDGTLVDSAPDLVGALNAVLEAEQLPPLAYEDVRRMVGHGARKLIERGFAASGSPLSEERAPGLVEHFIAHYLDRIAHETRPFPGCLETLDAFIDAGAILTVCTNKRTDLSLALLEALGMTSRFAAIIGADAAPAAKPDARHLQTAVAKAGGSMDRALLVGDSETDYLGARNAGAPIILATFGYSAKPVRELGADAVIDSYAELPAAVMRILGC
ncbi:MAG: phosphoglycolate phosphatase [Caulobacteraceae bacterium]|nr:phosphoglycolate phosphatase [Caulobacteraceae bacterium]